MIQFNRNPQDVWFFARRTAVLNETSVFEIVHVRKLVFVAALASDGNFNSFCTAVSGQPCVRTAPSQMQTGLLKVRSSSPRYEAVN
jgi:hypothetical protein